MNNGIGVRILDLSGGNVEDQFPVHIGSMIVFQDVAGHHSSVLVMNHREADRLVGMSFGEMRASSRIAKIAELLLD